MPKSVSEPRALPRKAAADRKSRADDVSRSDYVFQYVRDSIQKGELRQGMRLREEDLAELLGVSRTPVREALGRLVARGLVELAPGRGLMIAQLTSTKIIELYSLRAILEGAAARFAAEHVSPTEIKILRQMVEQCFDAATPAEAAAWNLQFHRMIFEVARNRYLLPAVLDLHDSVSLLPGTVFDTPGRKDTVLREHTAIVDALERRDPQAAEIAGRDHVLASKDIRMMQLFSRSPEGMK